ncbi:MAG: hypothetical protein U1C59_08865 [Methylotenera sp.]|nr:hypothetical protein [Methylotenera sp.]
MEQIAKLWNMTSVFLLTLAIVTAPFRGFNGDRLVVALVVGFLVLIPLALAAHAYRRPDSNVHRGIYLTNLALSVFVVIFLATFTIVQPAAVLILFPLLGLMLLAPAILNFLVLQRWRMQSNLTVERDSPKAGAPHLKR